MKKLFAMVLAFSLVLAMAACGGKAGTSVAEPAPAAPVEQPTAENASEDAVKAEALLAAEGTVTVTLDTLGEYEELLQGMGYTEFVLPYYGDSQMGCEPVSLTYNDQAFRFEFGYWDNPMIFTEWGGELDLETTQLYEGWVLYGMKSDGVQNISPLNFGDYPFCDTFDSLEFMTTEATRNLEICPRNAKTNCMDAEFHLDWEKTALHEAWYYPATGNLYNAVYTADTQEEYCPNVPQVLKRWNYALVETLVESGLPTFTFVVGQVTDDHEITADYNGWVYLRDVEVCYEPGMTLADWARSGYNMEGWVYAQEQTGDVLYSPAGDYVIVVGDLPAIEDHNTKFGCEIVMVSMEDYQKLVGK